MGISKSIKKTVEKVTKKVTTTKKPEKKVAKKITYPEIKIGATGDLVSQLQDFLCKDGSTVKVDGVFGIGTLSAVKAFQKRHKLDVDGVVGSKTWGALVKIK